MRLKSHLFLSLLISVVLTAPLFPATNAAQQPPQAAGQAFEPIVNRMRDGLKLNEAQVGELRKLLITHSPRLLELRNRAQRNPYAPGLQSEVDKEQKSIKDEFAVFLDDDQRGRLQSIDTRPLVPLGPAFAVVNIGPRARTAADTAKLANSERLISAPLSGSKGRAARLTDDQKLLHLLNRITFGPSPGDIARIKQTGIDRFIEDQLNPETIDDSDLEKRLEVLPTQRMASAELYQFYPPPQVAEQRANEKNPPPIFGRPQQVIGELVQQKLVRAVSSNRQLQEILTDFWFNHFNVFAQKEADQWFVTSYERDVIRPRVLGRFRDLLLAVAESPAMLYYLDNWQSASPDSRQPRPGRPQQDQPPRPAPGATPRTPEGDMRAPTGAAKTIGGANPDGAMMARKEGEPTPQPEIRNPQSPAPPPPPRPAPRKPGINENYARELMELHTLGVDGGYTQKDVQEVARCFTGWTIDRPFQGGGYVYRPWMHDNGPKTVLGVTIAAGGGVNDARRVIEILSRHPSTARFISKKLCQRFVSDDPPPQLVERIAQVFLKTDGDIREIVRAIVTSPEFNSPAAFRAKVKSPLELAASAIRALDGDTNGSPALHDWVRKMGEPLYQFAFPTGYGETSSKWVNTGVFFNRINYVVALTSNQINGTRYDPTRLVSTDVAANLNELTSQLGALIIHTELSAESLRAVRAGLADQTPAVTSAGAARPAMSSGERGEMLPVKTASPDASPERRRIEQVVGLIMGTAEFQRR